jgi:hypothetical protein
MAIKFNRSQTFATNGTVTAAGLHNLIDGTDIYQALITDQPSLTSVATDDSILIADASLTAGDAPRQTTVSNLFDDALTAGTYTNLNLTGALTYGTATGNRTVSTSATITTGTIPNLTAGTTTSTAATITTGTIPTLTSGTTTSTAANITNGTIQTLTSSTATITGGTFSGSVNSTFGTIGNFSTTLAGDLTISQGTATLATSGVASGTYGGSTSVPVLTLDAKGRVTTASTSAITTGYTGFRNRIINGDMRIDQRNAGASQTFTAGAALAYSVDRFYGYCTGANVTGQRVAGTAPNEFAYRFSGASSVTAIGFGTRLEATNTQDLAGSTATLSVQLANSLLTTVTWTAYYASTADAFGTLASPTRTQIATGTFTVNSTLTTYSTQISIPSAATTGLEIVFTVGAQTSGTWTIDNVQLEAGSSATAFERRPYGTELALCQRYYQEAAAASIISAANTAVSWLFPVQMRSSPTITMVDLSGGSFTYSVVSTRSGFYFKYTVDDSCGYTASSEL